MYFFSDFFLQFYLNIGHINQLRQDVKKIFSFIQIQIVKDQPFGYFQGFIIHPASCFRTMDKFSESWTCQVYNSNTGGARDVVTVQTCGSLSCLSALSCSFCFRRGRVRETMAPGAGRSGSQFHQKPSNAGLSMRLGALLRPQERLRRVRW